MAAKYICVPAMAVKPRDRMVAYGEFAVVNFTVHHVQWDNMPNRNYRCTRLEVTYQNGDDEFLFIRAHTPCWVFRREAA